MAATHLLISTKRSAPADDLTSFLLAAREEGEEGEESLNEHELVATLLLMIGGSQTTINSWTTPSANRSPGPTS
ncbi:hypothetical protein [Streptomyces rubradiris]|uniref:Uncharacterized protein n=1 Tax=Streptomyces rubradiris TaxID=285531 RepID=A0ABQ3RBH7_STRRR|nr:hypothetical protein [Streptomyces rubradiris]GHH27800.1 hypothetical protein GCM10018792_70620 [Streptomyces rubradiris]GHI53175.1 hypothetical protein Srubr_30210 [Streptomyces rubradiris]